MPDGISVVVGDYPHTAKLRAQSDFAGETASFPQITPVHDAFDDMVRTQRYDVCEMAIGAFLQAHEARKPLLLLPVVMVGGFHYQSICVAPDAAPISPADLKGKRIGVRAYSQTTGLWVRGWLSADYGVTPDSVTWVTTEGSHADEYEDPPNVVRTENSLPDELRGGQISAAILGTAVPPDLKPLIPDWETQSRNWYAKQRTVPINHMLTVTRDFAAERPDVLDAIYQSVTGGIDEAAKAAPPVPGALPSAIRHGLGKVSDAVRLAADYALEQGLISTPVEDIDSLFAISGE
jgi:4,5-dihydroxyphthalate decarboxylase